MKSVLVLMFLLLIPLTFAHLSDSPHSEVVVLSSSGFYPDSLVIPSGSTVVFVVDGPGSFWPASNFHPTHEGYPVGGGCISSALDSCRGLVAGENFTFVFDRPGRWGLHDHLHSAYTMNIEVIGEKKVSAQKKVINWVWALFGIKPAAPRIQIKEQTAPTITSLERAKVAMSNCKDPIKLRGGGIFGCYAKEMQNISYNNGKDFAYDVLFDLQRIDPVAKGCHFIAHGVGWGSYMANPSNWQQLIGESSPICSYGAQMGIIEMYVQSLPDGKLEIADVPELCGPTPRADCNHAVGHMMLLESKDNLSEAIDFCGGIKDANQNFMCLSGMFMERIIASNLIEHGIAPESYRNWTGQRRLKENEALCRSLNSTLANACWREMAHAAYYFFGRDPKRIFEYCDTAQTPAAAKQCKTHVLPELAGFYGLNYTKMRGMCKVANDATFERECSISIVSMKINFVSTKEAADTVEYCNSLPDDWKMNCFSVAGGSLKQKPASPAEITEFCQRVPDKYKPACLGKGSAPPMTIEKAD